MVVVVVARVLFVLWKWIILSFEWWRSPHSRYEAKLKDSAAINCPFRPERIGGGICFIFRCLYPASTTPPPSAHGIIILAQEDRSRQEASPTIAQGLGMRWTLRKVSQFCPGIAGPVGFDLSIIVIVRGVGVGSAIGGGGHPSVRRKFTRSSGRSDFIAGDVSIAIRIAMHSLFD
jgi:hypothetical protein